MMNPQKACEAPPAKNPFMITIDGTVDNVLTLSITPWEAFVSVERMVSNEDPSDDSDM